MGSWDDPLARATRGRGLPSLDARSWDHPIHPFKVTVAAALLDDLFEHSAWCASAIQNVQIDGIPACPQNMSIAAY